MGAGKMIGLTSDGVPVPVRVDAAGRLVVSGAFVSAKSYGATGDGTTDDTVAIQAALDNTAEAPVYLPPGTYNITTTLTIPAGVKLIGAGRGIANLLATIPTNTPSIIMGTGCTLSGLTVTSPYTGAITSYTSAHWDGDSRKVEAGDDCEITDVHVEYAGHGINVSGKRNVRVAHCSFQQIKHWDGSASCLHVTCSEDVLTVSTLTSSSTTATATTSAAHGLSKGDTFWVKGANETAYNGCFAVESVTSSTVFTYKMLTSASGSPATGTIQMFRQAANIRFEDVTMVSSDRGIEVEDGCRDVSVDGFACRFIYPAGNASSGAYLTYTFVAGVHCHDTTRRVENVTFANGRIVRCGQGIDVQAASSFGADDICRNIRFRDIEIESPADTLAGSKSPIFIEGQDVTCDDIRVLGSPTTLSAAAAYIAANAKRARLNRCHFLSWNTKAVEVIAGAEDTVFDSCIFPDTTGTASGSGVFDNGTRTRFLGCHFTAKTTSVSQLEISTSATGTRIIGNTFYVTSGTPTLTAALRVRGGYAVVSGNTFDVDSATVYPIYVDSGTALNVAVTGNTIRGRNANGYSWAVGSGAIGTLITSNTITPYDLTGSDSGTNTVAGGNLHQSQLLERPAHQVFQQTASVTVANTVTETTLVGAGLGSVTLPANFFRATGTSGAGKTIRIRCQGHYSDTLTPTLRLRVKLGSTTILDSGAITLGSSVSNKAFDLDVAITGRSTGVSGTVVGGGELVLDTAKLGLSTAGTITVNTTTTQAVSVTAEWGAASASNTVTALRLEIMQ